VTPVSKSKFPVRGPHGVLLLLPALLGLLGLAGNLLGQPRLAGLGSATNYMASLTACLLLLLVAGQLPHSLRARRVGPPWLGIGAAAAAAALSLTALILGQVRPVEEVLGLGGLFAHPMSSLTAAAGLGLALALLARAAGPRRSARQAAAALALLAMGISLVAMVALLAGAEDLYPHNMSPMAPPTALALLALGGAILLTAGPDTWPAVLFRQVPAEPPRGRVRPSRVVHIWIFLACGAGLLLIGSLGFQRWTALARSHAQASLAAIARAKGEAIQAWRQERDQDAQEIAHGTIGRKLAESLRGPGGDSQAILDTLRIGAFRRVVLFDQDGRIRAASPALEAFRPSSRMAEGLALALRNRAVVSQDLNRDPGSGEITLNWWVPIGAPAPGAVLLQVDPEKFLYPILRWPVASATAEILLVRRDKETIRFLNDLRFRPGAALTLAEPLDGAGDLPSARALAGEEGIVRGRDYRGVPVMASLARIPGTPWSLVAKIDEAEILGPLRTTLWVGGTLLTVTVSGMALLSWMLLRHRETRQFQAMLDLERERRSLADRYAHLMDQASDVILVTDLDGTILEANQAAASMYGRAPGALRGIHLRELRAPEAEGGFTTQFRRVHAGTPVRYESVHLGGDGARVPVEFSARQVSFGDSPAILIFIRDISEQKAREGEISRLVRLYDALSHVDQAIVKAGDRDTLLTAICRVMVENAQVTMAWIGWDDPRTHQVAVAAQCGDDGGYLDRIRVRSDDTPEGRGPMGVALRSGRPRIAADLASDPEYQPWQAEARRAGFASSAAFPVRQQGKVVAALSIHAADPDFFGPQEVALLEEAAGDLSFALDHLALEAEQRRASKAQAALYRIAVATLEAPSMTDLFQRIHAILAELMPARNFYIATRDEGSGLIRFPYFVDEVDPAPAPRPPARTLTDLVLATGESQLLTPEKLAALAAAGAIRIEGTRPLDWLGVPLVIQGATFGAMVVQSYAEEVRYTEEDVEFLQFAATQVAAGIRRKEAESALRDSEEKFSKIFNSAPILATLSRVSDGAILEVNDLFCQTVGYAREELLGHTSTGLGILAGEERARMVRDMADGMGQNLEFSLVTKAGQVIPCLFSGEVVEVGGEALLISMVADIASLKHSERERQLLQREIEHMQKLESLGRLAGGIAHDMNNVLAAIYAVTQAMRIRHAGTDLDRDLATVERAATRGRDLIKGLMGFTRKDLATTVPIDLNGLVREEMALLERTLLQKYRLVMDLEEPLPPVMGEMGPLGSALMNLCVNAVDAMAQGGTLTIRTRRVAEAMVEVAVEDTGEGMAPEVLQKAMEPFFTTKPMGKGTGLGLAMVFSTARAHGGALALDSQVGRGTQARMTLPCRARGLAGGAAADPGAAPDRTRDILLVDDDELLRAAMPGLLGTLGHRVETVDGGQAALDRLAQGATPDLVILDMNMPGMTGLETLRHLRALAPDLEVLFATGFLEPAAQAVLDSDRHTAAIIKPFTLAEISAKIARVDG